MMIRTQSAKNNHHFNLFFISMFLMKINASQFRYEFKFEGCILGSNKTIDTPNFDIAFKKQQGTDEVSKMLYYGKMLKMYGLKKNGDPLELQVDDDSKATHVSDAVDFIVAKFSVKYFYKPVFKTVQTITMEYEFDEEVYSVTFLFENRFFVVNLKVNLFAVMEDNWELCEKDKEMVIKNLIYVYFEGIENILAINLPIGELNCTHDPSETCEKVLCCVWYAEKRNNCPQYKIYVECDDGKLSELIVSK